jgi:signal transduction histidine kinase
MDVHVDINSVDPRRVKPEQAVEVLHIAQEALSNVQKHAKATDVEISLWIEDENLNLEILDNGISISPEQLQQSNGNGLRNMQERTTAINGELYIGDREAGGTEVKLSVPIY